MKSTLTLLFLMLCLSGLAQTYHAKKEQILWLDDHTFKIMPEQKCGVLPNVGDTIRSILKPCKDDLHFDDFNKLINEYYITIYFNLYDQDWGVVTKKTKRNEKATITYHYRSGIVPKRNHPPHTSYSRKSNN